MPKHVEVRDVQDSLADLLKTVTKAHAAVVIEDEGRPVAVMITPDQWESYQELAKADFRAALHELHDLNRDESPEEVERIIAEEVELVRQEIYERYQHNANSRD